MISAPDYWTARTRKWRFPFFERNNSSSVSPFSEFSNPSDFKVLWSRWQLQSFDIHVHVTYSLKLFFSLRSWCRCHPRFPLYRHTAVIQRLSRSSFKRIILYITFSPSPPPHSLSLNLHQHWFFIALLWLFWRQYVRVGAELICESTGWYNWRQTSYHQNTFFMLFWDIFQPTFSTQNLGVGWMKYACSIK